ncbi:GNAT family N-acetyltransferase [Clostridium sp. C2-6-12]|jgi:ribosomal protein S18 acetylase RimI-like enzyme|uniref:GNAT family N-acetyltransferase n=1 Tax=Clostridium sp. C2-6-12 TaxID=2698832 RepID=UPI001367C864|nr:GNAT family N-acetyltransferase [Clostridium sp. C2-6-12]
MFINRVYEDIQNADYIRNSLYSYNKNKVNASFEEISLLLKDRDNQVTGGLLSHRFGNSIFIEILWVSEQLRGCGYGSKLLKELELIAAKSSVRIIHLDTFDFQASDFYIKHGYEIVGTVKDTPLEGNTKYYFKKTLSE